MRESECGVDEAGVPWDDPLKFCESVDTAIASMEEMFCDDWRAAVRRVYDWANEAGSDPFASAVRLALDREAPIETVKSVFRSLCDHRQSLFAQKAVAIIGWAEATAGFGPTGRQDDDVELWAGAWDIVGDGKTPPTDIHGMCLPSIIQAISARDGQKTGIHVCDEFLLRYCGSAGESGHDADRAMFAVSALKDSLTVEEGLHSTYKGMFGGVLDILYWPAMSGCAGTRIRASLAGGCSVPAAQTLGDGTCERKTSSVTHLADSLTREAQCVFSG